MFFDLETTGTKFWRNGIHQISGAVVINGQVKESFNYHVRPNLACTIEEEALKVAGVTKEQVMAYPPMQQVYTQFVQMLGKYVDRYNKKDKFTLAGYNNTSFDNPFLRAWFVQNGDFYFGSWFWSSSIDVMVLAAQRLLEERAEMDNFKQGTVAKYMGVPVSDDNLHDALYDIRVCMAIYQHMLPADAPLLVNEGTPALEFVAQLTESGQQ